MFQSKNVWLFNFFSSKEHGGFPPARGRVCVWRQRAPCAAADSSDEDDEGAHPFHFQDSRVVKVLLQWWVQKTLLCSQRSYRRRRRPFFYPADLKTFCAFSFPSLFWISRSWYSTQDKRGRVGNFPRRLHSLRVAGVLKQCAFCNNCWLAFHVSHFTCTIGFATRRLHSITIFTQNFWSSLQKLANWIGRNHIQGFLINHLHWIL